MKNERLVQATWILLIITLLGGAAFAQGAVTTLDTTISFTYGPPPIESDWLRVVVPLTPTAFGLPQDKFFQILSNVQQFRICTEMSNARDVGCIDSVRIGDRYLSEFTSGLDGWGVAGDGTLEWKSGGGVPGGYLQISDWGSGDYHWAVAPRKWMGDWTALIGSNIVFYMQTTSPDYPAIIEISSVESNQMILSASPLIVPLGGSSELQVSLPDPAPTDVVVYLDSSAPGCLQVQEAVTIQRGRQSVTLNVNCTESSEVGCSAVIEAWAEGYATGRLTLTVGKASGAALAAVLEGYVTDAITKMGLPGVFVSIAGRSAVTDAAGRYRIESIPTNVILANFSGEPRSGKTPLLVHFTDLSSIASYTLVATAEGYMGTEFNLSFVEGETKTKSFSMTPIIEPGEMRLVLNWGAQPRDLDLHLRTPNVEGHAHEIYWDNRGNISNPPYVYLDADHQEGYGPETITISKLHPGTYRCFVENYSTIPALNASRAEVQIYTADGLLQTVTAPTAGEGLFWYVCDLDGATGAVTVRNIIQQPAPGAALASERPEKKRADQLAAQQGTIVSWAWDFDNDNLIDSYEKNPSFTYHKPGYYTVKLRVSDGSREYLVTKESYIYVQPAIVTDVSWSRQNSHVVNDLHAVFAVDTLHAWAAGADGAMLRTQNGGATWTSDFIASQFTLFDLHFIDAERGWAVGQDSKGNSVIFKTVNGGANWTRMLSSSSARLLANDMVSPGTGWNVGQDGKIEKTMDGGSTWTQQYTGMAATLRGVFFLDADKGCAVGDNGTVLRTSDGGVNWQLMTSGISSRINDVAFVNENLGWAVTSDGKVLATVNSGATWSAKSISSVSLNAIVFDNTYFGFIAGANGKLFKTYDGGDTWTEDASGVTTALNALYIINSTCAWSVGDQGVILRLQRGVLRPNPVTHLTATATGPHSIFLTWNNPAEGDFAGMRLLRKTGGYPEGVADGTLVYNGTGSSVTDTPLNTTTTYYYTAFAYDAAGRYSMVGATSRAYATTGESFHLYGYTVTVSSIDAAGFPQVKSFVSVVDSATLEPVTGLTSAHFGVREDGTVESPLTVETVSTSSGAKADIVFVFDTTGSMGDEISGLKNRASAFADALAAKGIDYRLALVTYGDTVDKVHDFTTNINTFKSWINALVASGGGDTKENSLEGLASASALDFRAVSQRIAILITDADYHEAGESGGGTTAYTTESMTALLKEKRIMCNVVGPDYPQFHQLAEGSGGLFYNITSDFQAVIDRLSTVLSSQYVVTYTTHNKAHNNTWRNVLFTVAQGLKGGWDSGKYFIAGEVPNVRYFAAVAVGFDRILCYWDRSDSSLTAGLRVLRKVGGWPASHHDGQVVYEGDGDYFFDAGLSPETVYYYRAFAYNSSGQYAAPSEKAQDWERTWAFWSSAGWKSQPSGISNNLYAVCAADSVTVWVAGENGAAARSVNGGASWESRSILSKYDVYDLDFHDQVTGWLVGQQDEDKGLVMKTGSAGISWTAWPTTSGKTLYANCMVTDQIGWNAGKLGIIEKTVDGGAHWTTQYSSADKTFRDVSFVNTSTGWVVGDGGLILKTVDGGATWTVQNSAVTASIRGVHFYNDEMGWAVAHDGKILQTWNGGASWEHKTVSDLALLDVHFADVANGIAVGQGGRIYATHDAGLSWTRVESGVTVNLNAVYLVNGYTGWIVGDAGTILNIGGSRSDLAGYTVTVNSVDADAFPVVKTFVSVVDAGARTAVAGLSSDQFKLREDGTLQSPISVEMVTSGSGARADIVFVFDVTGSMGDEIAGLKARAQAFADALAAKGIDYRLGLVTFSDVVEEAHDFTADVAEFKAWIDGLRASGGGDTKENALEGLARAARLSFRTTSQKMLILITDADYHEAGESGGGTTTYTTETMIDLLQTRHLITHVVGPNLIQFQELADKTRGIWFNITSDFSAIIESIGAILSSQYVITYTSSRPAPDNSWRQVAVIAEKESKGGYDIGRYYVGGSRLVIDPATIIGINGAEFTLQIKVESILDLGLVHFALTFDSAKVQYLGHEKGDFLKQGGAGEPILIINATMAGVVDASLTRSGTTTGASGNGTLLSMRFRIKTADCSSNLVLSSVDLRKPDNTALPVTRAGARIEAAITAGLVGDLDNDLDIDLRDFTLLSSYWQPVHDGRGDIGPASGTVPMLTPLRDGVVNFEDLFVFTRMWNWYQTRSSTGAALAKSSAHLSWRVSPMADGSRHYLCELQGSDVASLGMAHLRIRYHPDEMGVVTVEPGELWNGKEAETVCFVEPMTGAGVVDIALARLGKGKSSPQVAGTGGLIRLVIEDRGRGGDYLWQMEALDLRSGHGVQLAANAPAAGTLRLQELPSHFTLSQNYPNPFNGQTEFRFSVAAAAKVRITILNILGQPVRTIVDEQLSAGTYRHTWDGRNDLGHEVVSGIYLIRMEAGAFREQRRMAFVK